MNAAVSKSGYAEVFEELLRDLESDGLTIVIMVDEFPVAVENIAKAKSNEAAAQFYTPIAGCANGQSRASGSFIPAQLACPS
ncbi:MAG: hypothetical protein H6574_10800 [Lewinellaceae bacterium]|nr:hypothetical protein [Lewinellaceae bacterium]